ncbi:hypothetical protein E2C01_058988 [Portunus trituberculatus]|uniref:Uncharacterized protein n=1 Tax=Portunus trituberculatus TaxID=210409 RepID=A0A5B7H4M8_PORTR|nr:hypothetical protein [Portunus trituberculatus]
MDGRSLYGKVSGLHVLVIVLAAVLVTALLSCVLGHSKMGARLWSHRRSARAAHTTPASRHTHTTIITPTTFTHSVSGLNLLRHSLSVFIITH